MSEYVIPLADIENAGYCSVRKFPEEMPAIHRPVIGKRMEDLYRDEVAFQMSPRFGGKVATDYLNNTLGYFMISQRFRKMLEDSSTAEIEYLPIKLIDQKGRDTKKEYYIANVIGTIECIDDARTEGTRDPMRPETYQFASRIYLDESKLEDLSVFRPASIPERIVFRRDLAESCAQLGLTGMKFYEQGDELPY